MAVLYLEALTAIARSSPVMMAGAWVVQPRTGNCGWVDPTIRTFSLGACKRQVCDSALRRQSSHPNFFFRARTSRFFPLPPWKGVAT